MENNIVIILVIINVINAEWVEISQRHYEKTTIGQNKLYKTTPLNKQYANMSLKYNAWNKGIVSRVNNMGTIKRVQPESTTDESVNIKHGPEMTTENNIKVTETLNVKENLKDTINDDKREKNKAKDNQIEEVIKFLKVVTDTISRNTQKSVGSKLRYLRTLQDSIMANIEDRIEATWPDDNTSTSRTARSAPSAQHRGHVDFPSSESALMTLSFLTFAVYLIKLVLQLIQTYKNKTMMMTPTVFTVAKAAAFKGKTNTN